MVDQFERLYTDCEDVAERKRFVALLQCLATGTVKVVIGLRADFYHLALADLGEQLAAGQVALAPMSEQDLGKAITVPAEKLLRSFQPGLTQRLIADVCGRPGDLPLLHFALTELWERDAAGGVVTRETYRGLGVQLPDGTHLPGAQGALIRRAEQVWQDLGPDDRPRLQRILLGLIAAQPAEVGASPVAGTRDLSRPARLAQWDEDDQRLVQRLIDARLLTADKAPAGGQPTVEVSHEVLLRAWPRLQGWLNERSQFVQWRAQDLAPNLERWLDSNKNPEFLLLPSLIEPALQWLGDYPDELAGPPADYIQDSRRHRARRRNLLTSAVAVLIVASLTAAGIFYSLQQTAVQRQNVAVSGQLADDSEILGDTDPIISRLESVAAWRIYPSDEARYATLSAAARPGIGIAVLPGYRGDSGLVNSVAFSPGGKMLATGSFDGTVRLWYVANHQEIGSPLRGPTSLINSVSSVAFSPDGKILATGGDDHTVRLWKVATHQEIGEPLTGHTGIVSSVAFSPDGKTLATGSADGTVRFWNVVSVAGIGALVGHTGSVFSVAFSPDGKTLATGSYDDTARLWDLATQQQVGEPLVGHIGWVNAVAFSPDGEILATGSADGTVRLWNVATHQQIENPIIVDTSSGLFHPVNAVAFSPDGKILATGSADGAVRLWNVATHQRIGNSLVATVLGDSVKSLAFSPGGKDLATANLDGEMRLWDLADYRQIEILVSASADSVAFSPDGKTLAIGGTDNTVRLWDTAYLMNTVSVLCASAGRPFTRAEWAQYIPELPYRTVCP